MIWSRNPPSCTRAVRRCRAGWRRSLGLDGVAGVELVDDLAVVPPDQKGAEEGAERLGRAVRRDLLPGEAAERVQGDSDRGVEMGADHPAGDIDAERDAQAPAPGDGVMVADAARDDLRHDPEAEQDEDQGAGKLSQ